MKKVRVLFVCLGNICRSPLAEGLFQAAAARAGLEGQFEIDSAGTGSWHVGAPPDRRMRETAAAHGVVLDSSARQLQADDLASFDHVLAMDKDNLHDILYLDREGAFASRVRLFREYDPTPEDYQVPDPYYGGPEGFETVFQMVDRTAKALLAELTARHELA